MPRLHRIMLTTLLLAGCTDGDISQARAAVKSNLNDADSAKFRNERVYRVNGGTTVCGEVNAKNRMGGYAGFQQFSVAEGIIVNIGASATLDCQFAEVNSRLEK